MSKQNYIILGVVAAIIVITGGVVFATRSSSSNNNVSGSNAPAGKISFNTIKHEWGDVSAAAGEAKATFELTNDADTELELTSVKTSCACTTATIIQKGQRSMRFGMHTSTKYWSMRLAPRETVQVEVVFDPNFHAGQRGPITRAVYFESSDSTKATAQLTLSGNVVD